MSFRTTNQNINKLLNYKYIIGENQTHGFDLLYKGFNKSNQVNELLNKSQNKDSYYYEYIKENSKVKPYIDYDGLTDNNKNMFLITDTKKFIKLSTEYKQSVLTKLLNLFIHSLNKLGCNVTEKNILILDGSRKFKYEKEPNKTYYKISFHLTTTKSKFVFKNTHTCGKVLIPTLQECEKELYNNNEYTGGKKPPIDKAVYGKTQKYRTIFQSKNKRDKDSYFEPINGKCEEVKANKPLHYFVQYFKDNFIEIQTPLHILNDEKQTTEHITVKVKDNTGQTHILNTNYCNEIQKRLIKHGIETATVYCKKNNHYVNYNIMYNPNVDKCIYGCDHDRVRQGRNALYANINNGCIYVGCWGTECKSKNKISLGYILEQSPLEVKQNSIQVNNKYLTNDNTVKQECKKFIEDGSLRALCIKSGTATGKTTLLKSYIPLYEKMFKKEYKRELRILVISTRQSYARSMCESSLKDLNIINYLDYKEDETKDNTKMINVNRLCISIESLNKFILDNKRYKPYDVIIFDESESISRHIFSLKTVKYGSYRAFEILRQLISYSKKLFVLDADLSYPSLKLINNFDESQILKINNKYVNNKKEYRFTKDKVKFIEDIKTDIKNNLKVYVVVLSKGESNFIKDKLQQTLEDHNKNYLVINSDSNTTTKRQLANVNTHWINYDVVITTSTTGAGVDFNPIDENNNPIVHFNKVYGFIQAMCSPPTEFLQIMDRVRNPESYIYNVLIDSQLLIPDEESYIYTYEHSKYICDSFLTTELTDIVTYSYLDNEDFLNNEVVKVVKNVDYSSMMYYNHLNCNLNNQTNNYMLVLKLIIESRNNIYVMDETKHKQEKAKPLTVEKINEQKVSHITIDEYKSLKEKADLTEDERHSIKKVSICHKYNVSDSKRDHKDVINLIDCYIKRSKKNKIDLITKTFIKEQYIDEIYLLENERAYTEMTDHKLQNIINMYRRLVKVMKYDYTPNFKISIDELSNIEKSFICSYGETKSITNKMMDKYTLIQCLLTKYGMKIKKDYDIKKVDKKTKRIHKGYVLTPDANIYNAITMSMKFKKYYNNELVSLCENYTQYKHLCEGNKLPVKRIV